MGLNWHRVVLGVLVIGGLGGLLAAGVGSLFEDGDVKTAATVLTAGAVGIFGGRFLVYSGWCDE